MGRGLEASKTVAAGDLLFVSPPLVLVTKSAGQLAERAGVGTVERGRGRYWGVGEVRGGGRAHRGQ